MYGFNSICSFSLLNFKKNAEISKNLLLTTVKHALSVSLYEGIIFLSYFKEQRIKKCQKKMLYSSRVTGNLRRQQENNNTTVADEVDPELLAKVLANPEMRALLNSPAKTMK